MSFTVTVDVNDWDGAAEVGSEGQIDFFLFSPIRDDTAGDVQTTKPWSLVLANGTGSVKVPDIPAGNALCIVSYIDGFVGTWYVSQPAGSTITLVALLKTYQVDAVMLQPVPVTATTWQEVLATATTAASTATTKAGEATTAAATATSKAATATTASADAQAARDETVVSVAAQSNWTGAVTLTQSQSKSSFLRRKLTGNVVLTLAGGSAAQAYSCTIELQQDATGSRTITIANVRSAYGVAIVLSTAANAVDVLRLEWNGSTWTAYLGAAALSVPSSWVV